jgi:hypothetical protein
MTGEGGDEPVLERPRAREWPLVTELPGVVAKSGKQQGWKERFP